MRIIPYDNKTFDTGDKLSVEFWSKILHINISKKNGEAYSKFKTIIVQNNKSIASKSLRVVFV